MSYVKILKMKRYKLILILVNLILVLALFNWSVVQKEKILHQGQFMLLKLAPVDPRSLMQGDYMALNYEIADHLKPLEIPRKGYCLLQLDTAHVAHFSGIYDGHSPLKSNEVLIQYTYNGRIFSLGAESYFFEEGQASHFEKAQYGGLKVDQKGNSILIGLYDENRLAL